MRTMKPPEERRAEIIAAARVLFEKQGANCTKVSDITNRVGVAQGLFYYYFDSKEAVAEAVLVQILSEIEQAAADILENTAMDFYEKTARYIGLYLDTIRRYVGASPESFGWIREGASGSDGTRDAQAKMYAHLKKLIAEGVEGGMLQLEYPEEMALMVLHGLQSLSHRAPLQNRQLFVLIEQGLQLPKGSLQSAASRIGANPSDAAAQRQGGERV